MTEVEVVTFDFWNTLLRADVAGSRARRLEAWGTVLARRGQETAAEVLEAVFDRVSELFNEAWAQNRQFTFDHGVDAAFELLPDIDDPTRRELADVWLEVNETSPVTPTDGIGEALEALSSAGVALGIICDVGLSPSTTLRRHLDRLGLLGYFAHVSFSDEVGVYKPDGRIFAHALAGLGSAGPDRALHIGDLRRTDIAGARSAGWTAVRYRGVFDDPGSDDDVEGHRVIAHHEELVELVLGGSSGRR